MWLWLEPLDVLLFRGSRPFAAGEVSRAASTFPPTPLPLVGALRAAMICHRGEDPAAFRGDELLGDAASLGRLRFRGPFLLNQAGELVLPAPRDLLLARDEVAGCSFPALLQIRRPAWPYPKAISPALPYQLVAPKKGLETLEEAESQGVAGLRGARLTAYLRRQSEELSDGLQTEFLYTREPRLGIRLQEGRTVETGFIYTVDFIRMVDGAGLLLEVVCQDGQEEDLLPEQGVLALGGEARAVAWQRVEPAKLPAPLAPSAWRQHCAALVEGLTGSRGFFLYLLTPAIFAQGWLPDGVQEEKGRYLWLRPEIGQTARLVAAAVGKAETVSGWNLASQAPRPLYKVVPAGSVYFFETDQALDQEAAQALINTWHWQSFMTQPQLQFYAAAGFGLAAVGSWHLQEAA